MDFETVLRSDTLRPRFIEFVQSKPWSAKFAAALRENNNLSSDEYFIYMRELREDLFPRFVRSKKYLRMNMERYESKEQAEFVTKHSPFSTSHITHDDVSFLWELCGDCPQLHGTVQDPSDQVGYAYNRLIHQGEDTFTYQKFTGHVPCSAKQFTNIFGDVSNKYTWDRNLKTRYFVDFISAETESIPYSCSLLDYTVKMPFFMKDRRNLMLMTGLYDTSRKCYVFIGKSTTAYPEKENFKDTIPWEVLFGYMFYEIDETTCRYVHVIYLNIRMKQTNNNTVGKIVTQKRAKDLHEGFIKSVKQHKNPDKRPENSQRILDTLDDYIEAFVEKE